MDNLKVLGIMLAILLVLNLSCWMCRRREGFGSIKDDLGTYTSQAGSKATITSNVDGSQTMTILVPGVDTPVIYNRDLTSGDFFDMNKQPAYMFTDGLGRRTIKIVYNKNTVTLIKNEPFKFKFDTTTPGTPPATTPPAAPAPTPSAVVASTPVDTKMATSPYCTAIPGNVSNKPVPGYVETGIPRNKIPEGQQHLYILKSQVVPPVCPACPSAAICATKGKPPPPCPACARCPEPSVTCKAVPNYSAGGSNQSAGGSNYSVGGSNYSAGVTNYSVGPPNSTGAPNQYLPTPVLADFSNF
jgi:hypothetical protein